MTAPAPRVAEQAAPAPAQPGVRASVLLAYAAFLLVGISSGVGGVLLPAQITDYGVDKATIGLTFFTSGAGFLLGATGAGALIHRYGVRTTLLTGTTAFAAAALYTATRPPLAAFVAVALLAGVGTGLLEAALNAHLADLPHATDRINRLHAFFGVGALLGPLLAAWLLTRTAWTAVWAVQALICLPLLVGFLRAHPPTPRPARAESSAGPGLLATTIRRPRVIIAGIFLAVYVGLEISVGSWGYSYLRAERALSDLDAGYAVSGYWLGLTLGRFLISPIAGRLRLGTAAMAYACLGGTAAACLLIWAVPHPAAAAAGLAVLGFFLGPIFPTIMAVMPRLTEQRLVPTAIGITNGLTTVGGATLPWLAGTLAQTSGTWILLPFATLLAAVQLGLWSPLAGHLRRSGG
ncbi:MFS transporter [Catellatospora sp. KI3]|uniref:MFS transporter n=1 Tax=Catellatospora sp. KI3 TaxID=3041620 RepID=UPI00248250C9|nr:MFS transporter [Catellatospora sp. KI3]MDI1466053.1 MFS transporter [Catellatospora sp. KI3]